MYPEAQAAAIAEATSEIVFSIPGEAMDRPTHSGAAGSLKVPLTVGLGGVGTALLVLLVRSHRTRPAKDRAIGPGIQAEARKAAAAAYRDYRRSRRAGAGYGTPEDGTYATGDKE